MFLILLFVKCFWIKSSKSINQKKKKTQIFLIPYHTMLDRSIANLDPFTLILSPKYVNLRLKYVKSKVGNSTNCRLNFFKGHHTALYGYKYMATEGVYFEIWTVKILRFVICIDVFSTLELCKIFKVPL